ncbi:o-methyltransferas-like protein [Periconia macrospinosa]|uniref:O-methyltransferas-like protein n=1 Tax=Periconia macrospinosa TaxID=97972 RepID=A0A2V1D717_9PLEO|nr:o-methyltransferas-like protein [Periconia macrospinosa]
MDAALNTITEEVHKLAKTDDEFLRRRTIDKLRDLQYALETPEETMQRLIYLGLTTASVRIGLDLNIFNKLVDSEHPMKFDELCDATGADPILLGRILRHQSSLGMIDEPAQDTFTASQTTRNISHPDIQAGLKFCADILTPTFLSLPAFLSTHSYQNPTSTDSTPFNTAFSTPLSLWSWLAEHPSHRANFNRFMYAQRSSVKDCFSYLPLDKESEGWPAEKPLFVDVGGGTGQQCVALREKWPELKGRVVLQDLEEVVESVRGEGLEGVEIMAHDFFTAQPVKGAKFYYLRAIMHNHTDEKCIEILKNIKDAMDEESEILLDEIVMPDTKVEWFVTQTDLAMLVQFNATERTEGQWRSLLERAGLKVKGITTYTHAFRLSVIAATK